MAEHQTASGHRYDPLWNEGRTRRGRGKWANLAIMASVAAHAGLVFYIYETKFVPHYKTFGEDNAVTAELLPKLAPPPKPPEPPKPAVKQQSPPQPPLNQHIAPPSLFPSIAPPTIPDLTPPKSEPQEPVQATAPEPAKAQPPVIANPNWSSRPNGDDMARYYPERAQRLEMSGNVLLQCQVTAKGSVADCSVLSEDPAGYNFGDAALKLSRLFRMKPKTENGQPVEGATVKIPIAFRIAN